MNRRSLLSSLVLMPVTTSRPSLLSSFAPVTEVVVSNERCLELAKMAERFPQEAGYRDVALLLRELLEHRAR